eukprot:5621236-Pyramimonas_sp.AAC.1
MYEQLVPKLGQCVAAQVAVKTEGKSDKKSVGQRDAVMTFLRSTLKMPLSSLPPGLMQRLVHGAEFSVKSTSAGSESHAATPLNSKGSADQATPTDTPPKPTASAAAPKAIVKKLAKK